MKTALEAYGEKLTNKKFFQDFVTTTINSNLTGINSFLDSVAEYYKLKTDPNSEESYINKSKYENFEADIKKTTYYNIKSLYDRVGGGSRKTNGSVPVHAVSKIKDLNTLEFDNLNKIELFYNSVLTADECFSGTSAKSYDLYQIFSVVDRGNNDIGTKVLANLAYINKNYYTDFTAVVIGDEKVNKNSNEQAVVNLTVGSLSGLLSGLAKESGFISQQIPNYLNLNSTLSNLTNNDADLYNVVDSLFGTHTNTTLFGEDILQKRNVKFGGLTGLPGYVYQLGSITSRADTVGLSDRNKVKNDYLNSFCLDVGHDNNNEVKVLNENAPDEMNDSNITCFTVDFGRQNQQMFNGVQLDTSEFFDTEESIKTWVDLVNNPNVTPQTKNIFPVLEKRSYTCTVTSLGNATIQPLTYFYLRNVPLFHGTYWITNVTHKIVPNNMVTTFKGVRQPIISKNDVRKELLALMRQQKANILESVKAFEQIAIQGEPDTSGRLQTVQNSIMPYGSIAQDLSDGTGKIHYFDGKTIIGAYLYSITGSLEASAANLGIIATLYNTAKAFKNNTTNHDEIIKTMPVIAVGLMNFTAEYADPRYADGSKKLSLSKLFKESGNGYAIDPNCKLGLFLNDIAVSYSAYGTKMVIPNENPTDLIGTMKGVDTGLVDGNGKITLSSASTITLPKEPIPIKETTFFVEHILTSYDDGMSAQRQFDAIGATNNIYDVFNSFDPTNKKTINSFKEVNLISVTPETKTAVGGGNGLSEYTSFQSWCNYINATEEASGSEKTIYDVFWEFALIASNGDYDENLFNTFITSKLESSGSIASSYSQKNNYAVNLKAAWNKLPKKQKNNVDVAEKSIFNDIGIPVTYTELKADNPTLSFSIDFEIKFPSGYGDKEYDDLSDPDNQLTFWTDYRFMCNSIKIMQGSLIKDKTKATTTEKLSIKFLGTYKPNISFFTTKQSGGYGEINWSPLVLNNYYTLTSTTEADSVASKSGIDINKQNSYLSKIGGVIDEEYKLWENETLKDTNCDNPIVNEAIKKYFVAAKSKLTCESKEPWSAAFISFIMQKSGVEFPFSASHSTYIVKGRDDKNYAWQTYDVSDSNATVRVGDLVCQPRSTSSDKTFSTIVVGDKSHCDCVKEVTALKAYTYGGNVSNTVKRTEVKLTEAGLIDNSKYICVIKYQPKGINTLTKNTTISEAQSIENKKTVLSLLKNSGLNQISVAGVMGNMHKETGGKFNPLAINKADTNGYPSLGLIQWNGAFNGINSKETEKGFDVIGRTVNEQISFLFKMTNYKKWLVEVANAKNAGDAGYLFAKTVEICYGCNKGEDVYYNESKYGASDRSKLANDYYNRFNNTNDPLYWNGSVAPIATAVNSNDSNFFTVGGKNLLQLAKEAGVTLKRNQGVGSPFSQNVYNDNKNNSKVHWAVYDISNNRLLANSANASVNVYGASIPKVVVAAAAFDNNNGTLPTDDDYKKIIKLLVNSDNNVWDHAHTLAGGERAVNAWDEKMGYTMRSARHLNNNANAIDMCKFFKDVINKNFKGWEFIYKITSSCGTDSGRGRKCMPKEVFMGGKTGSFTDKNTGRDVNHDSCWIKKGDKFYSISVLTDQLGSSANNIIAQMFRGLYDEYIT